MEVKRIRVTNRKQFNLLVDRMSENPSVARGQKYCEAAGVNRQTYDDVWKDLANGLNSLGPPTRAAKDWQKVCQLKIMFGCGVKSKLAHNKREARSTGGGPNNIKVLSPIEEVVVNLLSLDKLVNPSGASFGLPTSVPSTSMPGPSRPRETPSPPGSPMFSSTQEAGCIVEEEEVDDNENAEMTRNACTSRRKRKHPDNRDVRQELLLAQTEGIKKIVENTGECARYARKMFKLREDEAKQRRAYLLQKEKDRKADLEFKLQLLKYKQKKLELLERQMKKK
ncbi:uncharacterized protein LOC134206162 [Armigeres subalbatus]|uniref:uncharacterized protein LOC134206162 n=1 Tax=Armigeres subalbatus TaxID=124917 RepID=UPI002ED61BBD